MFIVFKQFFTENGIERWYYGTYQGRKKANEVALSLVNGDTYASICTPDNAEKIGVMNLPH